MTHSPGNNDEYMGTYRQEEYSNISFRELLLNDISPWNLDAFTPSAGDTNQDVLNSHQSSHDSDLNSHKQHEEKALIIEEVNEGQNVSPEQRPSSVEGNIKETTSRHDENASCVMNAQNFHYKVVNLLENVHATQRYKMTLENGTNIVWGMADLQFDAIRNLIDEHGAIKMSRILRHSNKKVEKFVAKDITKKRSLAFCDNVIRGIALAEMEETLEQGKAATADSDKKARKRLLNKFTDCSRRDRSAGIKLENDFLTEHKTLLKDSEYEKIDHYFNDRSIFIFDSKGYLSVYVSPELCKKSYYFYQGENELFLVKNFKGFCRVDD